MSVRIAFVGAGSVVFTRNLLGDLFALPELRSAEIALHDIDEDRLETAAAMARFVAGVRDARPKIETHLDRRRAIADADFVLNMVQIGGHEATLRDFDIPERYGVRQTIGDTLGVGGVFRTLRTAPHMLALGRELAELCPDAWLLNYTNPMAALCQLVYQGTPTAKIVGLCHSVQSTVRDLSDLVGVPQGEVTFLSAGVNHQAFLLRFEHEGESLYPRLDERIEADPELQRRTRVALYRRFGYFQTESSEHAAEYVPWLMAHDDELERYRVPVREYVSRSEENLRRFEEVRAELARGEAAAPPPSVEYAATVVHSIVTGEPSVVYGNVPNAGLVPGLPEGTCVEVPCLVDSTGIRPTRIEDYPPQLAALNRTYVNVVELTVRAVLEERPELVPIAALLDPAASSVLTLDEADALCAELAEAHADLLPPALRRLGSPARVAT